MPRPENYVVIGAEGFGEVDVDTLPYVDIPEGVTRIYLGPGMRLGSVTVEVEDD